jgi:cytochrome c peroxidase
MKARHGEEGPRASSGGSQIRRSPLMSGPEARGHSFLRIVFVAVAIVLTAPASSQPATERPSFSPQEISRILSFGPWPQAVPTDPSNRVSGNAAAIALGELLFFDTRLSATGKLSCATCHEPERSWTDGKLRGQAHGVLDRNTSTLWNIGFSRWFGWDGGSDSLWAQSLRPMLESREMAIDATHTAALLRSDPDLACRYRAAFRADAATGSDETLLLAAAKALAAFQATLVSGRTPFDDYRDALARRDAAAAARYSASAERGLALFIGKGNCAACHLGPTFSNGEFADIGVPFFAEPGRVDPGRHAGIRRLQASPYNLLGPHNDDPVRATAIGTRHVVLRHNNWGEFRVPGLRNVAETAPYMHNGQRATLRDVVLHYSKLDEERLHADGERILRRLDLAEAEIDDLLAFLRSLSDGGSWRRTIAPPCGTN